MASDWKVATPSLGFSALDAVDEAAKVPLGTIIRAVHPTHGEGEFIYLKGGTSVVAGLMVKYSGGSYATTLLAAGDAESGVPVAVAMADVAADEYGWFQISGHATIYKTAVEAAADASIYISGTAGRFKVIASSGKQILGAQVVTSAAAALSSTVVLINRPKVAGFES